MERNSKREGMEEKREWSSADYAQLDQWFNASALPEIQNVHQNVQSTRRINTTNSFSEYHPSQNPPRPSENQMYWDPMLQNLVLQNPPMVQNPLYLQNTNTNFDHLLSPTNNTTSNLINANGFSTLGFETSGGGSHDFFVDQTLHHDQLAASLNRMSLSNNDSSFHTLNQRVPNNFMPSSTIVGNGGFSSTLEQEYYLERLNQCAFLMAAEQYKMYLNLNTTSNATLNSYGWNRSSSNSSRSSLSFGERSNSTPQRNGVSRGSRFANGAGRQRFGREERGQGLSLMSSKDQRPKNGFTRQPTPSYFSVPLEELKGQISLVAKDHVGCRFLQTKIEEGKMEEFEMIFNEVINKGHDHLCELMLDQSGTEFIQKLVERINTEGLAKILDLVMSDERKLKDICTDNNGSRAMQRLLERVETREQQCSFMRILKRITVPLMKTQPGHFVIQVCLKKFFPEYTKGVLEILLDNCIALAKDKFGCCLVQDCVAFGYAEAKERFVAKITEHAPVLSEDPLGNYVVQYIIGLKIPRITADLVGQLQGYFVNLSMNKHGSNVVEKIMKETGEENANIIINEMMNSPDFLNVLQNPYGNYVAQSALAVSKGPVHNALVNIIRSNYPHLHSHLYGKRVLDKTRNKHRA